jgi:MFS transporter, BCD family, chlorophyll transporter
MTAPTAPRHLGWLGIMRLGLVQTSIGAIVVMTTSTLNRVMVVELALPAMIPGALVALHYALQALRPRMGHGSDLGGRRTPWIIGGMITLALGGVLAATGTAVMTYNYYAGLALAIVGFSAIGVGVSAAGTTLLVLLTKRTIEQRRPAAATIVWLMMIAGFALTASTAGRMLDPFTPLRLVAVTALVCAIAVVVTILAVWGLEDSTDAVAETTADAPRIAFATALAETWADPKARLFTIFVFVSMIAFSAQDLILEPFAAILFNLTVGQTTVLSGLQNQGVFVGMIIVAVAGTAIGGPQLGSLRMWTIVGCLASGLALGGLVAAAFIGSSWPINTNVFLLGLANGMYASAAIASMMSLAGQGQQSREGVRMGLWGAAQGIAFGIGGFAGTAASDLVRYVIGTPTLAYACVFAVEVAMFVYAAYLAARVGDVRSEAAKAGNHVQLGDVIKRALARLTPHIPAKVSATAKGARP